MKLSSLEEIGLRCLVQMGRQAESSVTLAELSRSEGISMANVAKVMRVLRTEGLVHSTRGQRGGYRLARAPEDVNLGEAMAALGGRLFDPNFCDRHSGSEKSCTNLTDCTVRSVWRMVQGAVDQVLGQLTLQDILGHEEEVAAPKRPGALQLTVIQADA